MRGRLTENAMCSSERVGRLHLSKKDVRTIMSNECKVHHAVSHASMTQIFVAVSLAIAATPSQAIFTDKEGTTTITEAQTTITTGVQAKDLNAAEIKGSTGAESLTFDYQDSDEINAIVHTAQGHGVFTLSNFAEVHFENHTTAKDSSDNSKTATIVAVGNYWGPNPIKISGVNLLSFGTKEEAYYGSAVQALAGEVDINVGNLYINATGNGLYLQQSNNNSSVSSGNLNVEVADALVVIQPLLLLSLCRAGATEQLRTPPLP